MKITYEVSESEFLSAYESFWRANKQGSKTAVIFGLAGAAFGVFAYSVLTNIRSLSIALIALGLLLALFPLFRRWLYRRAYRENPKFHGPIETEFTDSGISTKNEYGTADLSWSMYLRPFETDEALLLSFSKNGFSILPKGAFGTEENLAEFRDLVEENVGEIKKI